MTQLRQLHAEFRQLQSDLFVGSMFVILDEQDYATKRYNQLLGYFYPCYRTNDWINPALPANSLQICDPQEVQQAYELYYS